MSLVLNPQPGRSSPFPFLVPHAEPKGLLPGLCLSWDPPLPKHTRKVFLQPNDSFGSVPFCPACVLLTSREAPEVGKFAPFTFRRLRFKLPPRQGPGVSSRGQKPSLDGLPARIVPMPGGHHSVFLIPSSPPFLHWK